MVDDNRKSAGATVYLMEELGDARMRCDQLTRYVNEAVRLVDKSPHKEGLYEVAGHLLQAVPVTLFKLQKALQAVALAANRIDYEEIKNDLRPEKVEQLENVLEDVRIRQIQRRSEPPMSEAWKVGGLKQGKFEEGQPADPTENMSPEDAEKWKAMNEEHGDRFKEAAFDLDVAMAKAKRKLTDIINPLKGLSRLTDDGVYTMIRGEPEQNFKIPGLINEMLASALNLMEHLIDIDHWATRAAKFKKASGWEARELKDMETLLKSKGYDPKDAKKLQGEGIGAYELEDRLKHKPGSVGSLEYTHGLKKKASEKRSAHKEFPEMNALAQDIAKGLDILVDKCHALAEKMEQAEGWYATAKLNVRNVKELEGTLKDTRGDLFGWGGISFIVKKGSENKRGKFEEGEPADPTENMTSEDAEKWKVMNEEHGDKFKKTGNLWKA